MSRCRHALPALPAAFRQRFPTGTRWHHRCNWPGGSHPDTRRDDESWSAAQGQPTGGRRWDSPTVIWGDRDGKDNEWRYPELKVKAQAESITVFIHLENTEKDVGKTELNIVHLDDFKLE